ncbi:MAG: hypothetical protein LQ351_002832 [Letrouitia transgressa]|nr:MAG: hypothetical protein LQ351_002832 [Letrouitia transgressa]
MTKRSSAGSGGITRDPVKNQPSPLTNQAATDSSLSAAFRGIEYDARHHSPNGDRAVLDKSEISDLRSQVTRARLRLRELRVELRQQHSTVRELEARFIKILQRHWGHGEDLDQAACKTLYNQISAALDELGPLEEKYEEKEDDLDTLDFELEAKETRFYERFEEIQFTEAYRSDISSSSHGSPASLTREPHPSYLVDESSPAYRYLSRFGDAKIVRERLFELDNEKDQYSELERDRENLGVPVYPPNVEFIMKYDQVRSEYVHELEKIEKDLHTLELEAGLDYSMFDERILPLTITDPSTRDSSPTLRSLKSDQLLAVLPKPVNILRRKSENDLDDSQSSRDRINEWILDRLKSSLIEKAVYKANLNDRKLDDSKWWKLVCEYWSKDVAAFSPQSRSKSGSGTHQSTSTKAVEGPSESTIVKEPAVPGPFDVDDRGDGQNLSPTAEPTKG